MNRGVAKKLLALIPVLGIASSLAAVPAEPWKRSSRVPENAATGSAASTDDSSGWAGPTASACRASASAAAAASVPAT